MSDDEMRAELERLRKENESLKKSASKGVSLKVSEKGGLSVYGLGRFPITLYKEQWTGADSRYLVTLNWTSVLHRMVSTNR